MIPVFFGSTLLVFYILQSVPDGPFEQAVKQIKMAQMASGEGGAAPGGSENNSMEALGGKKSEVNYFSGGSAKCQKN